MTQNESNIRNFHNIDAIHSHSCLYPSHYSWLFRFLIPPFFMPDRVTLTINPDWHLHSSLKHTSKSWLATEVQTSISKPQTFFTSLCNINFSKFWTRRVSCDRPTFCRHIISQHRRTIPVSYHLDEWELSIKCDQRISWYVGSKSSRPSKLKWRGHGHVHMVRQHLHIHSDTIEGDGHQTSIV